MARLGEWTREVRPDWIEVRCCCKTVLKRSLKVMYHAWLKDDTVTAYEYVGASVLLEPKWYVSVSNQTRKSG